MDIARQRGNRADPASIRYCSCVVQSGAVGILKRVRVRQGDREAGQVSTQNLRDRSFNLMQLAMRVAIR